MASSTFNIQKSAKKEQPYPRHPYAFCQLEDDDWAVLPSRKSDLPSYLSEIRPEEYAFRLLIRTRLLAVPKKTKETMKMVRRRIQNLRAA